MSTVSLDEALIRFAELMTEAADGEDVVIAAQDGTAVRLVPVQTKGIPRFGSAKGMFTMADDFDAPLEDFEPYER
ncbi:type II toxin-antitoxin system Phd/YefM family antitoxin [Longimicrobium sp.]|jgi:prevent-host-death family protein|uniref:type II toxin-antitoxin system Phd/YefM family antitoxin n=1 Tax=Longimicrobium sp. TaxID=2029185 RepID=UPI002F92CB39